MGFPSMRPRDHLLSTSRTWSAFLRIPGWAACAVDKLTRILIAREGALIGRSFNSKITGMGFNLSKLGSKSKFGLHSDYVRYIHSLSAWPPQSVNLIVKIPPEFRKCATRIRQWKTVAKAYFREVIRLEFTYR